MKTQLNILIDPDKKELLQSIANAYGVPVTVILTNLIDRFIREQGDLEVFEIYKVSK